MNHTNSQIHSTPLPDREGQGGESSRVSTYSFSVEPFHVDFTGHLFLGVLGNHLLNAAGHHSHDRGWGIDHLNQQHFSWVLSRLSIELTETPAQYEHVEVETWVESVMKLFTERNFLIRNADDGRIYGYARSIWAMIDMDTRQPSNLLELKDGDILNYVIPAEEKPCPIEKFPRLPRLSPQSLAVREGSNCLQAGKSNSADACSADSAPSLIGRAGGASVLMTHYSDVDINGHINSIKYIEHILDLFPREQFAQQRIRRFDIAYKAESYWGDALNFFVEEGTHGGALAATTDIEIRKHVGTAEKPAGETVVQAKVSWEKPEA